MPDFKTKYGTSNQTLTITLASLANNAAREATKVDNGTALFLDALVAGKIKTGTAVATGYCNVYAYGTADGGTTLTGTATGTDAAITLGSPPNVRLIGVIQTVASTTTYKFGPFSVARGFGGILPQQWGIIIENKSGGTISATGGDHAAFYQGIHGQSV
jgi:hypothetical protein